MFDGNISWVVVVVWGTEILFKATILGCRALHALVQPSKVEFREDSIMRDHVVFGMWFVVMQVSE